MALTVLRIMAWGLSGVCLAVYAIVGDGESQEGQVWEAVMLAAQRKLEHLIVFVDDNGCQVELALRVSSSLGSK